MKRITTNVILVWLGFFLVFLIGQASIKNFYSQDDPYYHARHSALINETGNLTYLKPWLTMHFLSTGPVDPWWGYHVLMAGFIHFFGVVWGSKILSALLAALTFAVFYAILAQGKISRSWLWTILFWGSSVGFLSRLLLERPHLFTPIILMLAWWLAGQKKYAWLFGLAAFYVLLYHLAPLIMLVAGAQVAVIYYCERRWDWRLLLAPLAGLGLGIILHPQTLNYIYVMYVEIWRVLWLHFSGVDLRVGGELITPDFSQFLSNNILSLIFYLSAGGAVVAWSKDYLQPYRREIYGLGLISGAWFLVSIVVPRGVEYWLPFAWLFTVYVWRAVATAGIGSHLVAYKWVNFFLYSAIGLIIAVNLSLLAIEIKKHNADPFPEQIKEAALWLKGNTPENSVVFYNNWGYWPQLFYHNQRNRYLSGMDPTFAYEYNPRLYWLWRNISYSGLACDQENLCPTESPRLEWRALAGIIRREFNAEYILLYNEPKQPFYQVLDNQKLNFKKVFANNGFIIYRVLVPHK